MPLSRKLALLGVLAALNSVVRLMGAGVAGIETVFVLIILAGYAFGSRFGFLLATLSMLTSAFMSGGVGPWLLFQVLAAALIGLGAGWLPKPKRLALKLTTLSVYAVVASYFYGALVTFWTWPLFTGPGTAISYLEGGSFTENALRFIQFQLVSGGLIWDTGRAITTVALILIAGKALLAVLKRGTTTVDYRLAAGQ
jgi:energy-coupling factor transport system substrate-specific component